MVAICRYLPVNLCVVSYHVLCAHYNSLQFITSQQPPPKKNARTVSDCCKLSTPSRITKHGQPLFPALSHFGQQWRVNKAVWNNNGVTKEPAVVPTYGWFQPQHQHQAPHLGVQQAEEALNTSATSWWRIASQLPPYRGYPHLGQGKAFACMHLDCRSCRSPNHHF